MVLQLFRIVYDSIYQLREHKPNLVCVRPSGSWLHVAVPQAGLLRATLVQKGSVLQVAECWRGQEAAPGLLSWPSPALFLPAGSPFLVPAEVRAAVAGDAG